MRSLVLTALFALALAGNPFAGHAAEAVDTTGPSVASWAPQGTDLGTLATSRALQAQQPTDIDALIEMLQGDPAYEFCIVRNLHLGRFAEVICALDPGYTDTPNFANVINDLRFFFGSPYPHCDAATSSCVWSGFGNVLRRDVGSDVWGKHNFLDNSWDNTVMGDFNTLTSCSDGNTVIGNGNTFVSTGGCFGTGATVTGDGNTLINSAAGSITGNNNLVIDSFLFTIKDDAGGDGNDDGSGDGNVINCLAMVVIDGDNTVNLGGFC